MWPSITVQELSCLKNHHQRWKKPRKAHFFFYNQHNCLLQKGYFIIHDSTLSLPGTASMLLGEYFYSLFTSIICIKMTCDLQLGQIWKQSDRLCYIMYAYFGGAQRFTVALVSFVFLYLFVGDGD